MISFKVFKDKVHAVGIQPKPSNKRYDLTKLSYSLIDITLLTLVIRPNLLEVSMPNTVGQDKSIIWNSNFLTLFFNLQTK